MGGVSKDKAVATSTNKRGSGNFNKYKRRLSSGAATIRSLPALSSLTSSLFTIDSAVTDDCDGGSGELEEGAGASTMMRTSELQHGDISNGMGMGEKIIDAEPIGENNAQSGEKKSYEKEHLPGEIGNSGRRPRLTGLSLSLDSVLDDDDDDDVSILSTSGHIRPGLLDDIDQTTSSDLESGPAHILAAKQNGNNDDDDDSFDLNAVIEVPSSDMVHTCQNEISALEMGWEVGLNTDIVSDPSDGELDRSASSRSRRSRKSILRGGLQRPSITKRRSDRSVSFRNLVVSKENDITSTDSAHDSFRTAASLKKVPAVEGFGDESNINLTLDSNQNDISPPEQGTTVNSSVGRRSNNSRSTPLSRSTLIPKGSAIDASWFARNGLMSQKSFKKYKKEMKASVMSSMSNDNSLPEGNDTPKTKRTKGKNRSRSMEDIPRAAAAYSSKKVNASYRITDIAPNYAQTSVCPSIKSSGETTFETAQTSNNNAGSKKQGSNSRHTAALNRERGSSSTKTPIPRSLSLNEGFESMVNACISTVNECDENERNAAFAALLNSMMSSPMKKGTSLTSDEVSVIDKMIRRLSSTNSCDDSKESIDPGSFFIVDPIQEISQSQLSSEVNNGEDPDSRSQDHSEGKAEPASAITLVTTHPSKCGSTGGISKLTDASAFEDGINQVVEFSSRSKRCSNISAISMEGIKSWQDHDSSEDEAEPASTIPVTNSTRRGSANGNPRTSGTNKEKMDGINLAPETQDREKRVSNISDLTPDYTKSSEQSSKAMAPTNKEKSYFNTSAIVTDNLKSLGPLHKVMANDVPHTISISDDGNESSSERGDTHQEIIRKDSGRTRRSSETKASNDLITTGHGLQDYDRTRSTRVAVPSPTQIPSEISHSKLDSSRGAYQKLKETHGDVLTDGMTHLSMAMLVIIYGKLREMSLLGHASVKLIDIDVNSHQNLARKKELKRLGLLNPKNDSDLYLDNTRPAEFVVRSVLDEYSQFEMSQEIDALNQVKTTNAVYDASLVKLFKTWVDESRYNQDGHFSKDSVMRRLINTGLEVVWFSDRHPDDIIYCICVDRSQATITVIFHGQESVYSRIKNSSMTEHLNPVRHEDYEGHSDHINLRAAASEELLRLRRDTRMSIIDEVKERIEKIGHELTDGRRYHLSVTGHSLGAGYATVAGLHFASDSTLKLASAVRLFTFASCRVGCKAFEHSFKHLEDTGRLQHARFTNSNDSLSLRPFWDMSGSWRFDDWYQHVGVHINLHANNAAGLDMSYGQEPRLSQELFSLLKSYLCGSSRRSRISEYQHGMHSAREYWLSHGKEGRRQNQPRSLPSLDELYTMKERLGHKGGIFDSAGFSIGTYMLISFLVSLEIALLMRFLCNMFEDYA